MAKNKPKGQKKKNVFQVANKPTKNKNKTKPVTTKLKCINAVKNEKVESLNRRLTDVQMEVRSAATAPEPRKPPQVAREQPREPVNVDGALQMFSQL